MGVPYGFDLLGYLPDPTAVSITEAEHFAIDYTFFLNLGFLILTAGLVYHGFFRRKDIMHHKEMAPKSKTMEQTLKYLVWVSYVWLAGGLLVKFLM